MARLRELYAAKAAPAWSWLVATLNDTNLIAVVLFCLIGLLVTAVVMDHFPDHLGAIIEQYNAF
jgi:hypothetical protein